MKRLCYAALIIATAVFGLTFSYQNHRPIEIAYFATGVTTDLSLLLFATFAGGLIIGYAIKTIGDAVNRMRARSKPATTRNASDNSLI